MAAPGQEFANWASLPSLTETLQSNAESGKFNPASYSLGYLLDKMIPGSSSAQSLMGKSVPKGAVPSPQQAPAQMPAVPTVPQISAAPVQQPVAQPMIQQPVMGTEQPHPLDLWSSFIKPRGQ